VERDGITKEQIGKQWGIAGFGKVIVAEKQSYESINNCQKKKWREVQKSEIVSVFCGLEGWKKDLEKKKLTAPGLI